MTFDLSQAQPRVPRQARTTSRRANTVPEVDPRQRGFRPSGDMRNARRGNSGEALLDALGMVERAAGSLQQTIVRADEKRQEELGAQGALDEAAGHVDEELVRKSRGYRDAVALGRAGTEWTKHKEATDTELAAFVETQDGLDLDTRQQAAAAWVEQRYFRDFALDPATGLVRDFGSPGAARAIAESVTANRAQLLAQVNARIEQRMTGEALGHFSNAIRTDGRAGALDLTRVIQMVPPHVPQEAVAETYLETAKALADELMVEAEAAATVEEARPLMERAALILNQAGGYAKETAGGFNIPPELKVRLGLSAAQRGGLLASLRNVTTRSKSIEATIRARRAEAAEDGFALRLVDQGPALTEQEVMDRVDDGTLTGSQGARWVNSIQSKAEAQQARSRALQQDADRDADRAREKQASTILDGYGVKVLGGVMSPAQGMAQLMQDLPRIRDPLVRHSVMTGAATFFRNVEGIRMDTPQAREFGGHVDRFEQGMVQSLSGRVLQYGNPPRRLTPDQAHGLVKQRVDTLRMRGANQLRDTGKAPDPGAMRAELMSWLNQTFPPLPKSR